jgi:SOS-response transcriptional repressor LexA
MTQQAFAVALEVKQATVAGWEKEDGTDRPGPVTLVKIARLAPEADRDWWHDRAQLKELTDSLYVSPSVGALRVPLYKGKIAAGTGRDIEGEVEREITLPREWFMGGTRIIALKVTGDSMSPLIMDGYYVLIDVAERDPKRLAGHMVAARANGGCTVKWLRKDRDTGYFQLVPQHVSEEYPVRIITPENQHEFGIIGRVVRWIGEPKPPKRSR